MCCLLFICRSVFVHVHVDVICCVKSPVCVSVCVSKVITMKLSSADVCHVLLQGAPSGSKLKRPTFHSSRGSLTGENGGTTHTSKPSRTGETPAMCPGYCRHVICFIKEDLLIASSIFLFINSTRLALQDSQFKVSPCPC